MDRTVLREGQKCLARGQFPEALELLQRAHLAERSSWTPLFLIGTAYSRKGDPETASYYYLRSIHADAHQFANQHELGRIWYRLREFEAARQCF